jgi:hypothetical protein
VHYFEAIETYTAHSKMLIWKILDYKLKLNCKLKGEAIAYNDLLTWSKAKTQYKMVAYSKLECRSYDFVSINNYIFNFRRLKN